MKSLIQLKARNNDIIFIDGERLTAPEFNSLVKDPRIHEKLVKEYNLDTTTFTFTKKPDEELKKVYLDAENTKRQRHDHEQRMTALTDKLLSTK